MLCSRYWILLSFDICLFTEKSKLVQNVSGFLTIAAFFQQRWLSLSFFMITLVKMSGHSGTYQEVELD